MGTAGRAGLWFPGTMTSLKPEVYLSRGFGVSMSGRSALILQLSGFLTLPSRKPGQESTGLLQR